MIEPLYVVLGWFAFATFIGLLPRRYHPYGGFLLLGTMLPVLYLLLTEYGALAGLAMLFGAASILRYPLIYLGKKLGRQFGLIKVEM